MLELYFAPGACSFVPHVALEAAGAKFEPKLVKLHKGEQKSPEYLRLNPNGQVPVLMVDGRPLSQIVAICDYIDGAFPDAGFLPKDPWQRSQAMSQLAWMNNTVHPTFTRLFRAEQFLDSDSAKDELKKKAAPQFRAHLERIQGWVAGAAPYWFGKRISFHDAYAFTFLRWGGFAGIDPKSLPGYYAYIERVMQAPPVAAALARERIGLDTYKG